jgi:hypothetical protein
MLNARQKGYIDVILKYGTVITFRTKKLITIRIAFEFGSQELKKMLSVT